MKFSTPDELESEVELHFGQVTFGAGGGGVGVKKR